MRSYDVAGSAAPQPHPGALEECEGPIVWAEYYRYEETVDDDGAGEGGPGEVDPPAAQSGHEQIIIVPALLVPDDRPAILDRWDSNPTSSTSADLSTLIEDALSLGPVDPTGECAPLLWRWKPASAVLVEP